MTMVASGVVTLTSGSARCQIAPGAGGAVAGFWWETDGRRIDWLRPASPAAVARGDAGEMAPFRWSLTAAASATRAFSSAAARSSRGQPTAAGAMRCMAMAGGSPGR